MQSNTSLLENTAATFNPMATSELQRPNQSQQSPLAGPLTCCVKKGELWEKTVIKLYPPDTSLTNLITGNAFATKAETGNIQAKYYNNFWFLYSKHPDKNIIYNSQNPYQAIITHNNTSLISLDNHKAIITSRTENSSPASTDLSGPDELGITLNNINYCFSMNKTVLIGSDALCDINTPGKQFSALLYYCSKGLFLNIFDCAEVLLNGSKQEFTIIELKAGDELTIDDTPLTIQTLCETSPPAQDVSDDTLCLIDIDFIHNHQPKKALKLHKSYVIGRSDTCEHIIKDHGVSRKHAQIIVYEDHIQVIDCFSKNGTYINNHYTSRGRARVGDLVTFAEKSYVLGHWAF